MMDKDALIALLITKSEELKKGFIHWLEIAPLIEEAKLKNLNVKKIIPKCRVWEIFSAYTFLKAQRPEFLKNPDKSINAEAISFLMPIYKKMSERERTKEFPTLVDSVLAGNVRISTLRVMSRTKRVTQGNNLPTMTNSAPDRSPRDITAHKIKAVENAIDVLDYLLDAALESMPHGELRKYLESKSHNLSIRLSCVASEAFWKSWKEKEEASL